MIAIADEMQARSLSFEVALQDLGDACCTGSRWRRRCRRRWPRTIPDARRRADTGRAVRAEECSSTIRLPCRGARIFRWRRTNTPDSPCRCCGCSRLRRRCRRTRRALPARREDGSVPGPAAEACCSGCGERSTGRQCRRSPARLDVRAQQLNAARGTADMSNGRELVGRSEARRHGAHAGAAQRAHAIDADGSSSACRRPIGICSRSRIGTSCRRAGGTFRRTGCGSSSRSGSQQRQLTAGAIARIGSGSASSAGHRGDRAGPFVRELVENFDARVSRTSRSDRCRLRPTNSERAGRSIGKQILQATWR